MAIATAAAELPAAVLTTTSADPAATPAALRIDVEVESATVPPETVTVNVTAAADGVRVWEVTAGVTLNT